MQAEMNPKKILVTLHQEQKRLLEQASKASGLTVTELIRRSISAFLANACLPEAFWSYASAGDILSVENFSDIKILNVRVLKNEVSVDFSGVKGGDRVEVFFR